MSAFSVPMRGRPPNRLAAVLFDWDGTLVNSAEASYRCYVRLFEHYGIAFDRQCFERTYSPNWHRTYEDLGLPRPLWDEADARWIEHYGREETVLVPGAREALVRLHAAGRTVALVTSGSRERVMGELSRFELLAAFAAVTCVEDARHRKPHPEALLITLERLRLSAVTAAYVGDSPEDVEMSRAAGVFAVGVPGGFPNHQALAAARPDLLAPDLGQAVDALLHAGPLEPGLPSGEPAI